MKSSSLQHCRVCGNELFAEALLSYENMPKAAQFMPDAQTLAEDRGVDLDVCQCSGCGLVQLTNDPVPYFREVVRAAAISEEMKAFRLKQFGLFAVTFGLKGKKALEIGCGRGEYLSLIAESGMEAYGIEHAEDSVSHCRREGLSVSQGFLDADAQTLPDGPFEAFFMLNFLEHLPDPNAALRAIYRNVSDDAVGIIEVPNFDMILRNNLFSEFIGDHLLYFTKETLAAALSYNGWEIIKIGEIWYDYIIAATVRKRQKTDISRFHSYKERLEQEIAAYVDRFAERRVAIWGAGHQALAVLSLAHLGPRIRYVVDSAPFKQGKFTPATHVPIVPPESLDSDPVDAVIVMAASYSDEVARIIREKYEGVRNVAILRESGLEEVTAV